MKDIPNEHYETLFKLNENKALEHIECALKFLKDDNEKRGLDKVVGDYTFEELIAALMEAQKLISSQQSYIQDLENEINEQKA